jgi:hypothetical protein
VTNAEIVAACTSVGRECWHWHISLYRELERLANIGETSYPINGVAGNLGVPPMDALRWARDLETAGLVNAAAPPTWDYAAPAWIALSA